MQVCLARFACFVLANGGCIRRKRFPALIFVIHKENKS
jgi:hypothetical protein